MVGYRVQNTESFNPTYICSYCLLLLRDPVQLIDCAHRMCQSCANELEGDMITCSECHEKTNRNKLLIDRGFKNDMMTLTIVCSLCNWTGMLNIYQNHLDQNHPNPICHACNQKFNSVNNLDRHIQYHCEKIIVDCPLKEFGCQEMILRINLSQHYLSEQHQNILMYFVHHLKSIVSQVMCNQLQIPSQTTIDHRQITDNMTIPLQEIDDTVNVLSDGIETLDSDIQRVNTESIHHKNTLDSLIPQLSTLKISIEEENKVLDSIKINQEVLQQDVESMGQKLNDMKMSSYDGTFVWKINDVQEKMAAAQSDRQTSIYSPPFYSSSTGYKMCLRLYLNGDGNARRTHMSLFFVLMRGEYDAILKFPFAYKVIYCLYDQSNQQNHIIDSFKPDIKSNSFQRPRSDMNIASGIPKFVPLTKLQNDKNTYIRDNTMYIKVIIDFDNIPKTMLPYVLSLNPGLTYSIQQTMIQQENVRQERLLASSTTNIQTDQLTTGNLQDIDTLSNISSGNNIN
ncbi:unnamed protein product [Rotaria sordida]|uniref:Uncharacterized protein n=1 Tax=Rotaria sordida TaxID=392033 RepID=A0A815AIK5_9BILA|nr:unnamed protein product [Rotaria sordida]CAF1520343.1 unnamed protein product [Rotaria sordida]